MPDIISGPPWPGLLKRADLYLRLIYTLRGLNHLVKMLAKDLGITPEHQVWSAYQGIVQELEDLETQVKGELATELNQLAKPNEKVTPGDLDRISQEIDQHFQELMAEGQDKEEGRP